MTAKPRRPHWSIVVLTVVALATALTATTVHYSRTGDTCENWTTVFTGYGTVSCQGDTVRLSPAVARSAAGTHAGLALSDQVVVPEGQTTTVTATVTTHQQLREGSPPNPWEVGWILWSYEDNDHFYALVLKPNGWEVSKQDPDYPGRQRFLASGSAPVYSLRTAHTVVMRIDTSVPGLITMDITADGQHLATVTDSEDPYLSGEVAAYCEDAVVDVEVSQGDS